MRIMRISILLMLAVTFTSCFPEAYAHARFKLDGLTKPRDDATGHKVGPCGNVARTSSPAVFSPGQTITVEWEETINHPGFFRIAFSPANDADFDSYILVDKIPDTQNDANVPHFYQQEITLPDLACTDCTLQLIQYMTEDPVVPTLYYSCADITMQSAIALPKGVFDLRTVRDGGTVTLRWRNPIQEYFQTLVLTASQPIVATPVEGQTYNESDVVGNAVVSFAAAETSYTVDNLQPGQRYYFSVIAQDSRQRYSPPVTATVDVPAAPLNATVQVTLLITQAGRPVSAASTANGLVKIETQVSDADQDQTHSFDWSATDRRIFDRDQIPETFTFDPSTLVAGNYEFAVTVVDSGQPPSTATTQRTIRVLAPDPQPGTNVSDPATGKKRAAVGSLSAPTLLAFGLFLLSHCIRKRRPRTGCVSQILEPSHARSLRPARFEDPL